MAEQLAPKELVTFEEIAISNMWEIAALVEVLERKGVLIRQEIYDMIKELRKRNPEATMMEARPKKRPSKQN